MIGEPAAAGTQAEPAVAPQAGTPSTAITIAPAVGAAGAAADGQEQPQAGTQEAISLEDAKKLRSEAQSLRRRLKEFEDAQRTADEASLSEAERLKRRVAELEAGEQSAQAALRELRLQTAIESAAGKKGFYDPTDAFDILAKNRAAFELDDDGQPRNTESLLNTLAKAKPYLVKQEPAPVAAGSAPLPVGATPRPTNGAALSDAEMQRRREAVYGRARAAL